MVTHPFFVGFLVAELPNMSLGKESQDIKERHTPEKSFALANSLDLEPFGVPNLKNEPVEMLKLTREQILNSINITKSLSMAYVMDQFEDFANHNAFELLARYETSHLVFNDDIQGTMLSGLVASLKLLGGTLVDHTFLFLGAGEANVLVDQTRKKVWLVDSKVTTGYLNLSLSPSSNYVLNGWCTFG